MLYNLCHEPWSRKCINCFDCKVTNIVFLESIQNFSMFKLQKSPTWKLKSPPRSPKSQKRPLGGDFAHVEDH